MFLPKMVLPFLPVYQRCLEYQERTLPNIYLKKSLGVPGSSAGFDGHGNDGIVDINDVELTLAPTYFGSERVRVRVTQILKYSKYTEYWDWRLFQH